MVVDMRDSMVFYRSFFEAVKTLPPEQFKNAVMAIMGYGFDGVEPGTEGIERTIYLLVKPQIDANNRRYQNGTKGGRPRTSVEPDNNQTKTKCKPSNNQTVTKPEPNVNDNDNVNDNVNDNTFCPEPDKSAPGSPVAISFMLNDKSMYDVTENDVDMFQKLYPAIDVMQEIRKVVGWCESNPKNRKTRSGAKRFLNGWLSRAQDRARPSQIPVKQNNNKFHNFDQRDTDYDAIAMQKTQEWLQGGND
ncbi:hypothetical protein GPL26_16375 [Enterocloster citroniae]|uniref:DUF6291 domain-containing protein n=2 Tax=Enterocloster citroniae TaxID=358743 RepID=A0AA41FG72_9FIRM|nr:hypothetical protein [Enterocloster citroniae]